MTTIDDGRQQKFKDAGADGEPRTLGEYNGYEIYPMPMFALLECADIVRTAAWYQEALGFGKMFAGPLVEGQPAIVHLRRRKYQDLMLVRAAGSKATPSGLRERARSALTFGADGELDALAQRASSAASVGDAHVEPPVVTPWNTRDLRVTDPDGHRLVFTERNADPSAHARVQAMFEKGDKT
jgi:uncharacterized glyoxalase superfamily protein PhnB